MNTGFDATAVSQQPPPIFLRHHGHQVSAVGRLLDLMPAIAAHWQPHFSICRFRQVGRAAGLMAWLRWLTFPVAIVGHQLISDIGYALASAAFQDLGMTFDLVEPLPLKASCPRERRRLSVSLRMIITLIFIARLVAVSRASYILRAELSRYFAPRCISVEVDGHAADSRED